MQLRQRWLKNSILYRQAWGSKGLENRPELSQIGGEIQKNLIFVILK